MTLVSGVSSDIKFHVLLEWYLNLFCASYSNGGGKKGCKVTWQKTWQSPNDFAWDFLGLKGLPRFSSNSGFCSRPAQYHAARSWRQESLTRKSPDGWEWVGAMVCGWEVVGAKLSGEWLHFFNLLFASDNPFISVMPNGERDFIKPDFLLFSNVLKVPC